MSQFSKRAAKEKAKKNKHTGSTLEEFLVEDALIESLEESLKKEGKFAEVRDKDLITSYCTYKDKDSLKYRAAVITFDPETKELKLKRVGSVSRQIYLMHTANMKALNVLIKKIKE